MADLHMTSRPGYTGKLNAQIEARIEVLAKAIGISNLADKFPHLHATDSSWRVPLPKDAYIGDFIDHTQLKAAAVSAEITTLCDEAKTHRFKAVCVNGCHVAQCKKELAGTDVRVACVCGFPLGQMTSNMKAVEAAEEIAHGAQDVDMVINVGALKERNYMYVYEDIKAVVDVCAAAGVTSKVIFETCLLTDEEIIDAAILAVAAGATFVKTSTGFSTHGSTPEVVDIMLAVVGNAALVKASGGVRDYATARQFVEAGVRRIGTSSGVAIVNGASAGAGAY